MELVNLNLSRHGLDIAAVTLSKGPIILLVILDNHIRILSYGKSVQG